MYNEERDRLEKYATNCVKIGLSERLVQVEEQQAATLVAIARTMIRKLNLPPDKELEAITTVRDELRLLSNKTIIDVPASRAPSRISTPRDGALRAAG